MNETLLENEYVFEKKKIIKGKSTYIPKESQVLRSAHPKDLLKITDSREEWTNPLTCSLSREIITVFAVNRFPLRHDKLPWYCQY